MIPLVKLYALRRRAQIVRHTRGVVEELLDALIEDANQPMTGTEGPSVPAGTRDTSSQAPPSTSSANTPTSFHTARIDVLASSLKPLRRQ